MKQIIGKEVEVELDTNDNPAEGNCIAGVCTYIDDRFMGLKANRNEKEPSIYINLNKITAIYILSEEMLETETEKGLKLIKFNKKEKEKEF